MAREGKHTVLARGTDILPIPRHARVSRRLLLRELGRVGVTEEEFMENY